MPKPKAIREKSKKAPPQTPTPTSSISIEAVPELFNKKVLEWERAQFQALSEIHKVLTEIRDVLKEE